MGKDERREKRNWQHAKINDKKQVYVSLSENESMLDEDDSEGMYESLQIKLGKTHLELHKIIAML